MKSGLLVPFFLLSLLMQSCFEVSKKDTEEPVLLYHPIRMTKGAVYDGKTGYLADGHYTFLNKEANREIQLDYSKGFEQSYKLIGEEGVICFDVDSLSQYLNYYNGETVRRVNSSATESDKTILARVMSALENPTLSNIAVLKELHLNHLMPVINGMLNHKQFELGLNRTSKSIEESGKISLSGNYLLSNSIDSIYLHTSVFLENNGSDISNIAIVVDAERHSVLKDFMQVQDGLSSVNLPVDTSGLYQDFLDHSGRGLSETNYYSNGMSVLTHSATGIIESITVEAPMGKIYLYVSFRYEGGILRYATCTPNYPRGIFLKWY